jgi:hypothetical protein
MTVVRTRVTALLLATLLAAALGVSLTTRRSDRRLRRVLSSPDDVGASAGERRTPSAWRLVRRDVRQPGLAPVPSPLLLELLAALLESGAPPPTALRHIAEALARDGDARAARLQALAVAVEHGLFDTTATRAEPRARFARRWSRRRVHQRADRGVDGAGDPVVVRTADGAAGAASTRQQVPERSADAGLAVLGEVVRMAAVAGLPPAALVRRAAVEERRRMASTRQRATRRLEVLLTLPIGLCLLPAFVLLGIVPVVVDLLSG